ncbi:MAG TPA: sulfatase-like hydrolase/transferase [Planctomycetota bacterium]|nr:sulfatase-like hydrolase/transferase [Planctomycetota bacterium]
MRRLLVVACLFAACGKAAPEHPNVLVITIDTLRPDALGAGTPAINAFFGEATRFPSARTVAPLTLPAHTSIFTGLYPSTHGIHDNVTEPLPPRDRRGFPLLAEQFKDAGYATAAFASRPVVAASTGISAGFDLYDCPENEGTWQDEGGYIPADERIRAALAWMEGAPRGRPWFVWVHFFDPHAPYRAFPGDAKRSPTRDSDSPNARYAGEVRRVDASFEKLLEEVGPDTVVVLSSDHGESLGEHEEPTHGPLCYGATIDTVLAVRGGGFGKGVEGEGLRSVMDVAPTLRRICGLPGVQTDGMDLAGPGHDTLVAESLFTWAIHGWGQCFGVTDGASSLVEGGSSVELFDRREDPGETRPLPFTHPAYEKLDRALERFRSKSWTSGEELMASVPPYGELRRHASGYLSRHENGKLRSPRAYLKYWAALEGVPAVIKMCCERRDATPLPTALRTLDGIQQAIPESPRVDHYRAGVLAAIADIDGVPARYGEAAWAELAAIEKGYIQDQTILPVVSYCVAAPEPEALRTLLKLLRRSGRKPTPEAEKAIAEAMRKLGVSESDPEGIPLR